MNGENSAPNVENQVEKVENLWDNSLCIFPVMGFSPLKTEYSGENRMVITHNRGFRMVK